MTQVTIDTTTAKEIIANADSCTKEKLKKLFGNQLEPKEITERIKDINDVMLLIPNPSKEVRDLIAYCGTDRKIIGAKNFLLAELIAEAYNEGWVPDWTNTNEKKWFAWFEGKDGSFSASDYDLWLAGAAVGSRLCFKSEKLLLDAVKKFPNVYKEIINK
jgi:hypothetical protein